MAVLKNRRKTSPKQGEKAWSDLKKMIEFDFTRLSNKEKRVLVARISKAMNDYDEIQTEYHTMNYRQFKGNKNEYLIRRNMCLIKMNRLLRVLYHSLFPLFWHCRNIKQKRITTYCNLVNSIISMNEDAIKRAPLDALTDKATYSCLRYASNEEIAECISIVSNPEFMFQRCIPYDKSIGEKVSALGAISQLEKFTISILKGMKSARRIMHGDNLYRDVLRAYQYVWYANCIFPKSKAHHDRRRLYLNHAVDILSMYDKTLLDTIKSGAYDGDVIERWVGKLYECKSEVEGMIRYESTCKNKLTYDGFDELYVCDNFDPDGVIS